MTNLLSYIALISGILLVMMFLLSIFGASDSDIDTDADGDGLGIIKSLLAFLSVGAWVTKILLGGGFSLLGASALGLASGLATAFILGMVFRWLLRNQEHVKYSIDEAVGSKASVYLKIPPQGTGIVSVKIKGSDREVIASSDIDTEIPTGAEVLVIDIQGQQLVVTPLK